MMFCMLGHSHHLELKEMRYQEELMKHGLKQTKLELIMVNVLNFVESNMRFMPITVKVVSDEEYQEWLSDAKIKFAKEIIQDEQYKKIASK